MKLPRRKFLNLIASAASLPVVSPVARAQAYPSRPVRWIVGFAAGGTGDILARLLGQQLSEHFGQPFIVETRPGAGTNIATEAVVRAPADGHTLLLASASNAINATLYEKLSFNFVRDIASVAGIMRVPNVLVVNPSVPARTIPEFIAYAMANPGRINMASPGIGTSPHLAGELFKAMTGVNFQHVPYRGGVPAFADLIAGQVQVMFNSVSGSIEHIRTGKLRPLAVTTRTRSEALPDIPTIDDFVPGYEASAFFGLGAPRNTPIEIVGQLNKEINAAIANQKIKARIVDLGGTTLSLSTADFSKLIAEETEKWGKVIKFAGIKPV